MSSIARFVVLDTETTGLNRKRNGNSVCDGHRIVEIGCVEIVGGLVTGRRFHSYIKPGRLLIDPKATLVHGITDDMVHDKPLFRDIVGSFLDFILGATLIIHNAPFDIAFIDQEFSFLPVRLQPSSVFSVVDTLQMARERFPLQRNDLDSLRSRFGVSMERDRHGALLDAEILAEVYLQMTQMGVCHN